MIFKVSAQLWMTELIEDRIWKGVPANNIVVVVDDAPYHSGIELVEQNPPYAGFIILRLGPYSAPLNPIEAVWSSVKAKFKSMLDNHLRGDLTHGEYLLRYLERLMEESSNIFLLICVEFLLIT
jgi:transposase